MPLGGLHGMGTKGLAPLTIGYSNPVTSGSTLQTGRLGAACQSLGSWREGKLPGTYCM